MGTPKHPKKALLFVATLFADAAMYDETCARLEERFGPIIMESPAMPWDYSEYYGREMGEHLFRRFLFFRTLIDEGVLAGVKLATNEMEKQLSVDGRRRINLDPGYITQAKVVLASTKDYSHRIYIGQGIYAEVTLMYTNKQLQKGFFTYSDYLDERTLRVIILARKLFAGILMTGMAA